MPRMKRRGFLALGIASATVLVAAGGAVALLQPGWEGGKLTARARAVFQHVGRGLLDTLLPTDPAAHNTELQGLVDRVEATIAGLPPATQTELSQLLALLGSAGGRRALVGLAPDWPEASAPDLHAAFEGMRFSQLELKRQVYRALHELVLGAHFAEPRTWALLNYPGPRAL